MDWTLWAQLAALMVIAYLLGISFMGNVIGILCRAMFGRSLHEQAEWAKQVNERANRQADQTFAEWLKTQKDQRP